MTASLKPGEVRLAHTKSGSTDNDEVVVAELDDHGITVKWPGTQGFAESLVNPSKTDVPDPLIIRDSDGWLTISDGYSLGNSSSTIGHSVRYFRYERAVCTGARGIDYSDVNGMTSEITGLAKWAERDPVASYVKIDKSSNQVESISMTAKNLQALPLGGPLGLKLITSYQHNPQPESGVYKISTSLLVRTETPEATDWKVHMQSHRMMQDLMCLVYGKPCAARLDSVMREDDQDFNSNDDRRQWRRAYQPSFGRTVDPKHQVLDKDSPLFYLEEANSERVSTWLSEYDYWSRPTWIAMSALFHNTLPVESRLLQVAVALEALTYAIAKRSNPSRKPSGTYEAQLKRIFDSLGYDPMSIVSDSTSPSAWCKKFNIAYKGVKHADNDLTDPKIASEMLHDGFLLFRCWLGAELGVPDDIIYKRLHSSRNR